MRRAMIGRLPGSPLLRPLATTVLLALAYGAYQVWLGQVGAAVLPESALAGPQSQVGLARVGLAVTLAVDPEPFHMAKLQALGRVIAVHARTALIADAAPADARRFARNYWVARIEPWHP